MAILTVMGKGYNKGKMSLYVLSPSKKYRLRMMRILTRM